MEIAAFEQGRGGLAELHAGARFGEEIAVAQAAQLGAEIDEAFRDDMHDEAGALQASAHGQEARRS